MKASMRPGQEAPDDHDEETNQGAARSFNEAGARSPG